FCIDVNLFLYALHVT
nr:TSH protein beta chain - bovine (fragments) [Bos taurus]